MPINIIDNFEVSVNKPIDNRFVVGSQSFYTNRDSILYKYAGLRIWDLNDNAPYFWTGITWSNENVSGTVIGTGTSGYIPKFVGTSPTSNIANSVIFESVGNVGIGTTSFGFPVAKLQVNGSIRVAGSGIFYGNGSEITNINANNIATGTMNLARLQNGTFNILSPGTSQILRAGPAGPVWVNPNTITVGTASNATITNNTVDSSTNYLTFVQNTSGSNPIRVNSNRLQFIPSTGQLTLDGSFVLSAGTINSPSLRFGDLTTGIFRPGLNSIGFSTDGTTKLTISSAVISTVPIIMLAGTAVNPSLTFLSNANTGIYKPNQNQIAISTSGVERIRISDTSLRSDVSLLLPAGSATAPSISFVSNTNTGIYRPGQNQIAISTNGVERIRISDNGISILRTMPGGVTPGRRWSITGINISGARWLSNLSGASSPTQVSLGTETYDRIFHAHFSGDSVITSILVYIEDDSSNQIVQYRTGNSPFSGITAFIPAGKNWSVQFTTAQTLIPAPTSSDLNCFITPIGK